MAIETPAVLSADCKLALADLLQLPSGQIISAWDAVRGNAAYDWHLFGTREVAVPVPLLADVQRRVLDRVLRTGPVSPAAYAGVPGRSYVAAAWRHLGGTGAETVVMDIAGAFGSTTYGHVRSALSRRLKHELWVLGLDSDDAKAVVQVIAHLVTVDMDGRSRQLPLGAPTSVALFNLVLLSLDGDLARWCVPRGIRYTRYVDDMVFSCSEGVPDQLEEFVEHNVERFRFRLNQNKTVRSAAGMGTVHGLVRTADGIVPGEVARRRFADNIQWHARQAEDEATSEAHREKSRGFLKGLNTFLRQFYERQDLARPEMLKIHVPEGSTAASPLVDLLWE